MNVSLVLVEYSTLIVRSIHFSTVLRLLDFIKPTIIGCQVLTIKSMDRIYLIYVLDKTYYRNRGYMAVLYFHFNITTCHIFL